MLVLMWDSLSGQVLGLPLVLMSVLMLGLMLVVMWDSLSVRVLVRM